MLKYIDLKDSISKSVKKNYDGWEKIVYGFVTISLAQLKAGDNSEKLKNEIRQLLYYLNRSKKLTKQIYESLIDII